MLRRHFAEMKGLSKAPEKLGEYRPAFYLFTHQMYGLHGYLH